MLLPGFEALVEVWSIVGDGEFVDVLVGGSVGPVGLCVTPSHTLLGRFVVQSQLLIAGLNPVPGGHV